MKRATPSRSRFILARISIWTIINHNFLAERIRTYIWAASATVLFLSIASIVSLQVALYILLFCGCGMLILLWSLIHWRKTILLDIQDAELKQTAHAAMLALIHARQASKRSLENHNRHHHRWLDKKSHP